MIINAKSTFKPNNLRKNLLFTSLSLLLLISCFSSCILMAQGDVSSSLVVDSYVSTDNGLRTAVTAAVGLDRPFVIALNNDITLADSTLTIPNAADVTLISNGESTLSLYGVYGESTITVNTGGTLRLVSIIVTHIPDAIGSGITVNPRGSFVMSGDAVVSGNTADTDGGGVCIVGGGGSFVMSGDAVVSDNTARNGGGGVYVCGGSFVMSGDAVVSGNTAAWGGGVFATGGSIIIPSLGSFVMSGDAVVSGNTAGSGGGVCVSGGLFTLYSGRVSGNVASGNGGGVWVTDSITDFNSFVIPEDAVGVVFENNRAFAAYNRDSIHDQVYETYVSGEVSWSAPFTQGYNNYDVSYVYGTPLTFDEVELTDVTVVSLPSKMVYLEGEVLDLTDMVVIATYSDGSRKVVADYITIPADGTVLYGVGEQFVIVSYTQDGVTMHDSFAVMVLSFVDSPIVHVDSVVGRAGDEVTLMVSLENNPGIASYSMTMRYPDTLAFVFAGSGDILSANFYADTSMAGQVTLIATSPMGTDISTGSLLFTITFKINDGVGDCVIDMGSGFSLGYYTVGRDGIEHKEQLYQFSVATQPVIIVRTVVYGDVNGDGVINTLDVTRLLRYVWNVDSSSNNFVAVNADVNGDGVINTLDVTRLLRYVWNIDPSPLGPKIILLSQMSMLTADNSLVEPVVSVSSASGCAGDEVSLVVSLENNPGIASYYLTMRYPDTLTYVSSKFGDILTANFYADTTKSGQVALSATSPDGTDKSTGSILFTITFEINENTPSGIIDDLLLGYFNMNLDGIEHNGKLEHYPISQGTITVLPDVHVHDWVKTVVEPTCEAQGYTVYTCDCGDTYIDDCTDALGHNWDAGIVTDPNCEHYIVTHTCLRCYQTYDELYFTVGHQWVDRVIVPATCEAEGDMTYVCMRCPAMSGHFIIPALGHDLITITVDATCEDAGSVTVTCNRCEYEDIEILEAIGHLWNTGVITIPATETSEGLMTYTCLRYGETRTEVIPKLGSSNIELLQKLSVDVLRAKKGFDDLPNVDLVLTGKTLTLFIDGKAMVLSVNANNMNQSGQIDLGDGYTLFFDIKGNGSNVKEFSVIKK